MSRKASIKRSAKKQGKQKEQGKKKDQGKQKKQGKKDEQKKRFVVKRDGRHEQIVPKKILDRLSNLKTAVEKFSGEKLHINVMKIAKKTSRQVACGITTSELDVFAATTAAETLDHPDYLKFAGNILVSNLMSNNKDVLGFRAYVIRAYGYVDEKSGRKAPLINKRLYEIGLKYGHLIDSRMDLNRNFLLDFFSMQTLLKNRYLLSDYKTVVVNGKSQRTMVPFETPQHMMMRIALELHGASDLESALHMYDLNSRKLFTMATPTLFNAGTRKPQMSSCFLLKTKEDSIDGIFDTLKQCAKISKEAGGIGLAVHNVRCKGSYIESTRGHSNGLVPMLRVFNNTALYVDQGGGKRKGSFAMYVSPYHADIFDWLELKKNVGAEELRARDLFFGLWISDLFMRRVVKEFTRDPSEPPVLWSLMDPKEVPGLDEAHNEEFERMYEEAERSGKAERQVPIRDLWCKILETQIETGLPYMLYKDSCNRKSNQKNLGTIKSSNLCTEIIEYTSPDEVSVCNLASICLPRFVVPSVDNGKEVLEFDYQKLYDVCRTVVRSLDLVIDKNYYPVPEAERSNRRHRPIGLGVQGLANVFTKLKLPYDSPEAMLINRRIAETMYFAALTESHTLAVECRPYPSIDENGGAPIRHGVFQQEMWEDPPEPDPELGWDWEGLRAKVKRDGVRNSLLRADMPTASTSQIMGNTESFEPNFSNIFTRKTMAGEFFCVNEDLVKTLIELDLWHFEKHPVTGEMINNMKERIVANRGSIQNIPEIPDDVKKIFRTVMEIPLENLTLMARDRAVYIDQSSSLNVHFANKDNMMPEMTEYHCFAWKLGLKTGSYYTRTIQDTHALTVGEAIKQEVEVCETCSA
jgi:ribonucleoside-diphosphate reductase alpha chain